MKNGDKNSSDGARHPQKKTPWITLIVYCVMGILWIFFSDHLVELISPNYEVYSMIQTYKGVFYILATTFMLYILFRVEFGRIFHLNQEVRKKNQELQDKTSLVMEKDEQLKEKIESLNQAMRTLNMKNRLIEDIYRNSNTGISLWDKNGILLEVNDGFRNLFGYGEEDTITGKKWTDVVRFETYESDYLDIIMAEHSLQNSSARIIRCDGAVRDVLWSAALSRYSETEDALFVSFWVDITSEKNNERLLYKEAYTDRLTGLKNKAVLDSEATQLFESGISFTILYLDMDDFKNLNEYYGYSMGDTIIKTYANDLIAIFGYSNVFRFGGDEFLIMLKEPSRQELSDAIDSIIALSSKVRTVADTEFYLTTSVGIATAPMDGMELDHLISKIDMALYHAKRQGKNKAVFYEEEFQYAIEERIEIDNRINEAINNNGFELYYQPVYSLEDGSIHGLEALLRWKNNPFKISTEKLIRVAEETGKIQRIDHIVIRKAFAFVKEHLNDQPIQVAINLSAKSAESRELAEYVRQCAAETGVDPHKIIFEITEHSFVNRLEETKLLIEDLKKDGYEFSLDDFGTGHSSLNHLVHLNLDYMKIDKSYIDFLDSNENSNTIVLQIIYLAQHLGLKVVAEGIEEESQRQLLREYGCEFGQGYLMARPLREEDILKLLP